MSQSSGWNLVAMSGPHNGMAYPLTEQGVNLGRAEECEVVLQSQNVSRKHARVFVYEGNPYVQDLGSRNGVFVNGMRVQTQGLQTGDTVTMGEFVFQISSGPISTGKSGSKRGLLFGVAGVVVVGAIAAIALQGQGGGTQPAAAPVQAAKTSQVQNMFATMNEPGKAPRSTGAKDRRSSRSSRRGSGGDGQRAGRPAHSDGQRAPGSS